MGLSLTTFASVARATHVSNFAQYFEGWLAPGQGTSTVHWYCDKQYRSEASWDAVGWHVTVALIEPSGGWIASSRSSAGAVFVLAASARFGASDHDRLRSFREPLRQGFAVGGSNGGVDHSRRADVMGGDDEFDPASRREVGVFRTAAGRRMSFFTARRRADAKTCLVVGDDNGKAGACSENLVARLPAALLETFTAGSGGEPLLSYEVWGVAGPTVTRVDVVDTLGRAHRLRLNEARAFLFDLEPCELQAGVRAAEVVVHGPANTVLARIPVLPA